MIIAVDGPTSSGLGEANVRFPPITDTSEFRVSLRRLIVLPTSGPFAFGYSPIMVWPAITQSIFANEVPR